MQNKHKKGFTLIELLVVIAIIGLLASIVLVSLNTARVKARDTKRIADLKQVQLALEMAYDQNKAYPNVTTANACSNTDYTGNMTTELKNAGVITTVPTDPGSYQYLYGSDVSGTGGSNATSYVLVATLESSSNLPSGYTQPNLTGWTGCNPNGPNDYIVKQ